MNDKQYKRLELAVEGLLFGIGFSVLTALLLGIYALASWVF